MFIALLIVQLACLGSSQAPIASIEAPEQETRRAATATIPPVEAPETPVTPPAADLARPLSEAGPWWLFRADDDLWAVNPDGSGLTAVIERSGSGEENLFYGIFPNTIDDQVAIVEVSELREFSPPRLSLLSLPDGEVLEVAVLLPDDIDYAAMDGGEYERALDRWAAVGVWNRPAWSPDGEQLAFNGAMDGPSSDLYVYSKQDGDIVRLTSGPTESVRPVWSPNGENIVHGAVNKLNYDASGNEYNYDGVWSAKSDGSSVELLFESGVDGFESVVGWAGNSEVLIDTLDGSIAPWCQEGNLRTFGLETGASETFFSGQYFWRAFDPATKTFLFSIHDQPDCDSELIPGLYLLRVGSGNPPLPIVEDEVDEIRWSEEASLFFGLTSFGVLAVTTDGQFIDLVDPEGALGLPIVAPQTRRLAWIGDGLWIGALNDSLEQQPTQITSEKVWEAAWGPDGEQLLFITGDSLYAAAAPDFTPVRVFDGRGSNPVWVPAR